MFAIFKIPILSEINFIFSEDYLCILLQVPNTMTVMNKESECWEVGMICEEYAADKGAQRILEPQSELSFMQTPLPGFSTFKTERSNAVT